MASSAASNPRVSRRSPRPTLNPCQIRARLGGNERGLTVKNGKNETAEIAAQELYTLVTREPFIGFPS